MTMATARRRRGSVLLMAIGLLTIVALIASMFLIVAGLDAQEAEILTTKYQADTLAATYLSTTMARIGQDRWVGMGISGKPYSGTVPTGVSADWRKYMDYPADGDANKGDDTWLSSAWTRSDPNLYAYLTNLVGTGSKVATNGDGNDVNAYRVKTPTTVTRKDINGNDINYFYYIAVHVSDLAGKLCLNTAGQTPFPSGVTGMPDAISPVCVDLRRMLNATRYNEVHKARCDGTAGVTLKNYDDNCGRILLAPASGYTPFSIADETFLLWKAPATDKPITNVGRLYGLLSDANSVDKRQLTTFACTGAIVRHPDSQQDSLYTIDLSTDPIRQTLYQRVLRMFYYMRLGAGAPAPIANFNPLNASLYQRKMAAHFVANLWAYVTTGDEPTRWAFQPSGQTFKVYGMKQDLVITEAYAAHKKSSSAAPGDPNDDHFFGYAVELMNPTDQQINLSNYRLRVGGNTATLSGTIPAASGAVGSKKVLFNCGSGPKYSRGGAGIFGTDPNNSGNPWLRVPQLDLSGSGVVTVRLFRGSAPVEAPVDEFNTSKYELDYPLGVDKAAPTGADPCSPEFYDARRDDRRLEGAELRARYNIAAYARTKGTYALSSTPPVYLAQNNGLNDNDLTTSPAPADPNYVVATYSAPVFEADIVDTATGRRALRTIGELSNIYCVGPIVEGSNIGCFPQRVVANKAISAMFNDVPSRGRLDPTAFTAFTADSATRDVFLDTRTTADAMYPDLPPATFFNEFLTHLRPHARKSDVGGVLTTTDNYRVYGLINVNTAPKEVLRRLPWPLTVTFGTATVPVDPNVAIDYLMAYRDKKGVSGGPDYSNRATAAKIANLRVSADSAIGGIMTPGEAAVPLGDYMETRLGSSVVNSRAADYLRARNALYVAVADCVTTRSDTYAVNIRVDLEGSPYVWYYLAVVDRSDVIKKADVPALLLFAEVK